MLTEGSTKSNRKTPTGNARPKFPPPSRKGYKMREDLIRKRDELKQKLTDAEEELKNYDDADFSDDQRLAIYLHKKMCNFNHTDGCSWFYHIYENVHDWDTYSHKEWLQKAQRVLTIGQPVNFIIRILDLLYEK